MTKMNEVQRRKERAIENYECALMNNTKWREVLDILGAAKMPVQFSFVREEGYGIDVVFPEGGCVGDHTLDCCVHGPFYLRDIYAIKCPKYQRKLDSKTGVKYHCEKRFNTVLNKLDGLGELPISVNEDGFEIYGYKKS